MLNAVSFAAKNFRHQFIDPCIPCLMQVEESNQLSFYQCERTNSVTDMFRTDVYSICTSCLTVWICV